MPIETTAKPLTDWEPPASDDRPEAPELEEQPILDGAYDTTLDVHCDSCGVGLEHKDIYWRRIEVRCNGVFDDTLPFCAKCAGEMRR